MITYDPVLEVRELPRVRMFSPLRPPQMGTAMVLEAVDSDPLVVYAGESVPESRLGNYGKMTIVDMSQYGLRLEEPLPSADRSFLHQCSLTFTCRVQDPALVVARGIRDMTGAMRLPLVRTMRAVARLYDIDQANEAEDAIGVALESFEGDAAVRLGNYLVELGVPGAGADASSERFFDATRKARLDRIDREAMARIISSGRDEVLAQWLAKHGGDPSALLEMEAETKAVEAEQMLRAMHMLTNSGTADEPFDTQDERRRIVQRLLSDSSSDKGASPERLGSRRSRIAGSLMPADAHDGSRGDAPLASSQGAPASSGLRDEATSEEASDDANASTATSDEPTGGPIRDEKSTSRVRGLRRSGPPEAGRPKPKDPDAT